MVTADFYIKVGDRLPTIRYQLKDNDDAVVNLTGHTVKFLMKTPGGAVKVNASATVTDAATGKVSYSWVLADTDTAGQYHAEWEVTYSTGEKQSFPNDRYLVVEVKEQLA